MGIKQKLASKQSKVFLANILAIVIVLIVVPTIGLYYLDSFTNHGEKIKVPYVMDENSYEAEIIINRSGLNAVVSDSIYQKGKKPGVVLAQNPTAGSEVKSGRIIYLTKNMLAEPLIKFPDLANNSSRREAEAQLKAMGFTLTPCKEVKNEPKDLVLGIMQGVRELHAGDKVSKEKPLTLIIGSGPKDDDTIIINTPLTSDETTIDDIPSDNSDEDFF